MNYFLLLSEIIHIYIDKVMDHKNHDDFQLHENVQTLTAGGISTQKEARK